MDVKIKVSVIITDTERGILLLKEKTEKNDRPLWNIVKGTFGDHGNENIFEAAIRECREEAGVDVELEKTTGCYMSQKDEDIKLQFNFIGKIVRGTPHTADIKEQSDRNEDISEIRWFTPAEIVQIDQNEFISKKIFLMVRDWLDKKIYTLDAYHLLDK